MKPNQIITILDTISFFCVTLDLYGAERINRLHERIHSFAISIKSRNLKKMIFSVTQAAQNDYLTDDDKLALSLRKIIIGMCIIGFFVGLIVWGNPAMGFVFALLIGIFLLDVLRFLAKYFEVLLRIILYILGKVKLEGLLLISGTIIFLISRTMSFISP